jgi:quercetin dioxygenase-like cupin family protein
MPREGQTIHNRRSGQRMTITTLREDILQVETINPPSQGKEPLHTHPRQASRAEVHAGTVVFEVDGTLRRVAAGESVDIPAGASHRYWNDGPETARQTHTFWPALNLAEFFETYAVLAARGALDSRGMPNPLQLAVMIPEFADVIRVTRPRWPVQKAFAAAVAPIARRRGYRAVLALP